MKKLLILITLTLSFQSSASNFSLGLAIGTPTGLNYSYQLDNNRSIEGVFGWTLTGNHGNVDAYYVQKEKDKFMLQAYNLDFKYGLGAKMRTGDDFLIGPSALTGVEHQIDDTNFKLLANGTAGILLGNSTHLDLSIYLGARYNF